MTREILHHSNHQVLQHIWSRAVVIRRFYFILLVSTNRQNNGSGAFHRRESIKHIIRAFSKAAWYIKPFKIIIKHSEFTNTMISLNNYMRCSSNTVCDWIIYMRVGSVCASHSVSVHSSSTQTVILYVCGAYLTPSLHAVVSLGLL